MPYSKETERRIEETARRARKYATSLPYSPEVEEAERKERFEKLKYLSSAHVQVRKMLTDEEEGIEKYEDLGNLLNLAGSIKIAGYIRNILVDERKHVLALKTAAETLRQAINQLERGKP